MKKSIYPQAFKDYVYQCLLYLLKHILHSEYAVEIDYLHEQPEGKPNSFAAIEVDDVYLRAIVDITPRLLKDWAAKDYRFISLVLCHEASHLITHPLWAFAYDRCKDPDIRKLLKDVNERQTQRTCNAVLNGMPKNWYLPEKLKQWAK